MPSERSTSASASATATKDKSERERDPEKKRSRDKGAADGADNGAKTHKLSLKGSSKLVSEFFEYSINTILFQRGVYPPEDFTAVKKYGLNMLVTSDEQIKAYIKKIMGQLNKWMQGGKISKLVIVITDKETGEHVERWQFDVEILSMKSKSSSKATKTASSTSNAGDQENADQSNPPPPPAPAAATSSSTPEATQQPTEEEIQNSIRALFRQITASVTFLPSLTASAYTFNVLVYADADSDVPIEWGDSDAKEIENAEKVVLRSFSTGGHRVGTVVSYKFEE